MKGQIFNSEKAAIFLFLGLAVMIGFALLIQTNNIEKYIWTDVTMNLNTFCRANGYSYGEPWTANWTDDNVKCFMNTSDDQGSFKTFRIWNTTRTINDTSYVYCNGERIYQV